MSTARRINTDLGFIPMKTIEDMKQNAELILGDSVLVSDNLTVYKIVSEVQPIKLNNNLYAKVLVSSEDIKQNILNLSNEKLNKGNFPEKILNARGILDLLENNVGLTIDWEYPFLNDTGVKTQGKIYFDRNKKGLFECIKTTEENNIINSTDYYVEYSTKLNFDRIIKTAGKKETNLLFISEKIALFFFLVVVDTLSNNNSTGFYQGIKNIPATQVFSNKTVKEVFFVSSTEGRGPFNSTSHQTYISSQVVFNSNNFNILVKSSGQSGFSDNIIRCFGLVEFI